jgi:hypothetical protein
VCRQGFGTHTDHKPSLCVCLSTAKTVRQSIGVAFCIKQDGSDACDGKPLNAANVEETRHSDLSNRPSGPERVFQLVDWYAGANEGYAAEELEGRVCTTRCFDWRWRTRASGCWTFKIIWCSQDRTDFSHASRWKAISERPGARSR